MTHAAVDRLLLAAIIACALGVMVAESKGLRATFACGIVGCAVANLVARRGT